MSFLSILLIFLLCFAIYYAFSLHYKNKQLLKNIRHIQHNNQKAASNKSNFLATASHDLQQPHQATGLFLASLNLESLDLENTRIINKAKDAHESTSRLLDQLLDISRLDTQQKPELQAVALHDFIHNLGMKFMPVAACHGIELRIRQREAFANTDPVMLERILTNFLLNAIRHAKCSSILLCVRHRSVQQQNHWSLDVYDNGKGIPQDKKSMIFEEFTQLRNPNQQSKGLGLGLAIVQRLSHILHHPVMLKSRLGRGSCFSVQLPAISQALEAPLVQISVDSVIRQRLKVAIIVQNTMIRESLTLLISSWGCRVEAFATSHQVLQHMQQQAWQPDALIIDGTLQNTRLNLDDIHQVREMTEKSMRLIMITQDLSSIYAKEAQKFGFALIADPIQPRLLKELLSDSLA
ncbi:MAG: ATP-binding protein [Mariprofundaceae bacterium]|nr:ATP-binding protein [Mariprofundaceae bacterium]